MQMSFAAPFRSAVPSALAISLLLGTPSCGRNGGGGAHVPPAEAILERQIEQVHAILAATRDRPVVDFNQIVVTVNGAERFRGVVKNTLSTLLRTAAERNDPELLFPARIDL